MNLALSFPRSGTRPRISDWTLPFLAALLLPAKSFAQTSILATEQQVINWRDPIINNRGTIVLYAFSPGNVPAIFRNLGAGIGPLVSAGTAFQRIRAVALDDEDRIIFGGETTDSREGIFFGPELPDEDDEWAEKGLPTVLASGGGYFLTDGFAFGTLFRIEPSAGRYWSMGLVEPDTEELVTDPPPQMNRDGVVVYIRRQKQTQLYTLVRAQLVPDIEPDQEEYFVPEMQELAALPSRPSALSVSDNGAIALGFSDEAVVTLPISGGPLAAINIPNVRLDGSMLSINDDGVIAVTGSYFDPIAGRVDGILRIEGGAATKIVALGDLVGNDYTLASINFGPQAFNNAGHLVFSGSLESRTNGPPVDAIMITSGGNEPPVEPPVDGYHWINEAGGSFNSGSNWDENEVPESSDAAFLDLPGSYTVTGGGEIGWLFVGNEPSVNVTFADADISAVSTDPERPGVFINEGRFTLASGELRSAFGLIGASAVTHATISGGLWENQALLTIGRGGETTMAIEEEGHVRSPLLRIGNAANGAFSTLTVDGGKLDLVDLDLGRAGTGTLIIENGGNVTVSGESFGLPGPGAGGFTPEVIIGSGQPGSTGRLIIRGDDADTNLLSRLTVADTSGVISSSGATGELLIEGRGVAAFRRGLIVGDLRSAASLTIRGSGSELIVTNSGGVAEGSLSIAGIGGRADLLIDGGSVTATHVEVGNSLGVSGLGVAVVTNTSFLQVEKTLTVGGRTPDTGLTVAGGQVWIGNPLGDPGEDVDFPETTLRVGAGDELAGTLTINGSSILTMARNRAEVGRNGVGRLIISGGGQFTGGSELIVGDFHASEGGRDVPDDGKVVVTGFSPNAAPGDAGARSSLLISEDLSDIYTISIADRGELLVEAGAIVHVPYVTISGGAATHGRLVVSGVGNQLASTLIAEQISLGDRSDSGHGELVVASNAIVSVQTLRVFANAKVRFDTGAVIIGPGDTAPAGSLVITSGGRLEGDGRLVNEALPPSGARLSLAATPSGGVLNLGGIVAPGGASGGVLTIQGNYTQATEGTLEIGLAGPSPSQQGQLIVTGTAIFEPGTRCRVILLDPDPNDPSSDLYVPSEGDTFNLLTAENMVLPPGSNLGDFIEIANAPPALEIDFNLAQTDGEFRVTARTIRSPLGAARLTIHHATEPGRLALSWPTNLTDFLLESSPSIDAGPWVTVTNAPRIDGVTYQIILPITGGMEFFRLID